MLGIFMGIVQLWGYQMLITLFLAHLFRLNKVLSLIHISAEYLLEGKTFAPLELGMLLANAASSLQTDIRHQQLIDREGDQAASPAVFVYTLPNVVSLSLIHISRYVMSVTLPMSVIWNTMQTKVKIKSPKRPVWHNWNPWK